MAFATLASHAACLYFSLSAAAVDRGRVVLVLPPFRLCFPHALLTPNILLYLRSVVHAVQEELKGKDITLLAEGGLKTKEDIGKLF